MFTLFKLNLSPLYPPLLERKGGGIRRRGFAPSNYPGKRTLGTRIPIFKRLWGLLKLLPALYGMGQGNIIGVFQFGAEG